MSNGAGGTEAGMVDPCHFDVIVADTPPEETNVREMSVPGWTIQSDPNYVRITTANGFPGGIWKMSGLATVVVVFFNLPDVYEFLEQMKAPIDEVLWQGNHPRDGKPAAIIKDTQGAIWGVHQHQP